MDRETTYHDGSDDNLSISYYSPVIDTVHTQNDSLGVIENWRSVQRSEDASIRDGCESALQIL